MELEPSPTSCVKLPCHNVSVVNFTTPTTHTPRNADTTTTTTPNAKQTPETAYIDLLHPHPHRHRHPPSISYQYQPIWHQRSRDLECIGGSVLIWVEEGWAGGGAGEDRWTIGIPHGGRAVWSPARPSIWARHWGGVGSGREGIFDPGQSTNLLYYLRALGLGWATREEGHAFTWSIVGPQWGLNEVVRKG